MHCRWQYIRKADIWYRKLLLFYGSLEIQAKNVTEEKPKDQYANAEYAQKKSWLIPYQILKEYIKKAFPK